MNIDFKVLGARIREIRLSQHLTQQKIADIVDKSYTHISNVERGETKISLSTLIEVCNVLGVTVDYILQDNYIDPEDSLDREILKELQLCDNITKEKILDIIKILNK